MSRQDKATTERNTRTLRELVRKPENKLCADCKRNDPRWASWNLGVFLCIRCSGIHRGMGTHISKVKSVDLDVWTPEQMESIQKWGNRLANLYWEAHLKPGHVPPEHKMESFIRSKYESKRWALNGPPPTNPSELEGISPSASAAVPQQAASPTSITAAAALPRVGTPTRSPVTSRQPQPHQLLSATLSNHPPPRATAAAPAPAPVPAQPQNDLFSLDFHAPATSPSSPLSQQQPAKDVKQDILSLFSAAPAVQQPPTQPFGQFASASPPAQAASPWGQTQQQAWGQPHPQPQPQQPVWGQPQQPQQQQSTGASSVGLWGTSTGWSAPTPAPQPNVWGRPTAQPNLLASGNDIWGSSNSTASAGGAADPFGSFASGTPATTRKKDDAFGDIWGGFK